MKKYPKSSWYENAKLRQKNNTYKDAIKTVRLSILAKSLLLDEDKIINCYMFGSRVYQTYNGNSDYDYIIIYKNDNNEILDINNRNKVDVANNEQADGVCNETLKIQATIYSHHEFIEKINLHNIDVLECIFLDDKYKLKETIDYKKHFNLDLDLLRRYISGVCSNSFVKAKKKIKNEHHYIGKKSMFHSLRIAHYGIQIAKCGYIIDYINLDEKYNTITLYDEIMKFETWEELNDKYKQYANNLRSDFRLLAPLNK